LAYFHTLVRDKFATQTNDHFIISRFANISMQPVENIRVYISRLTQIIKVIGNNCAPNQNKPDQQAEQVQRGFSHDSLTFHVNLRGKYYQTFFLLHFFHA